MEEIKTNSKRASTSLTLCGFQTKGEANHGIGRPFGDFVMTKLDLGCG
jgi:hypothetical protein